MNKKPGFCRWWQTCHYKAKPWEGEPEFQFCLFHQDIVSLMFLLDSFGVKFSMTANPYELHSLFLDAINEGRTEKDGLFEGGIDYDDGLRFLVGAPKKKD